MKRLALIPLVLLAACGHTPEPRVEIRTVTVQVPIPVTCVVDVPQLVYSDTDEALRRLPDETWSEHLYRSVLLLLAGRIEREAQNQNEKAARAACNG